MGSTINHFWRRWSSEYLQQLQALSKWRHSTPNLQVGDVVVIRDDTPFTWPLASSYHCRDVPRSRWRSKSCTLKDCDLPLKEATDQRLLGESKAHLHIAEATDNQGRPHPSRSTAPHLSSQLRNWCFSGGGECSSLRRPSQEAAIAAAQPPHSAAAGTAAHAQISLSTSSISIKTNCHLFQPHTSTFIYFLIWTFLCSSCLIPDLH